MRGFTTIVLLTLHEARRRRLVFAAFICAIAFLAVVAAGMYFGGHSRALTGGPLIKHIQLAMTTVVGLYAAHFFVVVITIVLAIDTVSGELESGVMQTLACKPVLRSDILLGKWVAFYVISSAFALLIVGGVLISAYYFGGLQPPDLVNGLLLMLIEIAFVLTIVIAGGTIFGTIVNGIVSFGLFAIAFVGGWIEQIGAFAASSGAQLTGVAMSLVSPGDAVWRLAAFHLQPTITRDLPANPFTSTALANGWMIAWVAFYSAIVLGIALRVFSRRSL